MQWLATSKTTTFTSPRLCPPSQGARGSRSQAGSGSLATKGPQKNYGYQIKKKVVPKSSAKPKAAVPRRPHCTSKGNLGRKMPRVLLSTTHSARIRERIKTAVQVQTSTSSLPFPVYMCLSVVLLHGLTLEPVLQLS